MYARSVVNLIYYPLTYLFRATPTLLPHESTVVPMSLAMPENYSKVSPVEKSNNRYTLSGALSVDQSIETKNCAQRKEKVSCKPKLSVRNSSLPHPSPAIPTEVTHHHDTDEDDSSNSDSPVGSVPKETETMTAEK